MFLVLCVGDSDPYSGSIVDAHFASGGAILSKSDYYELLVVL